MKIDFLQKLISQRCAEGKLQWTQHFMQRIIQRCISLYDIEKVLLNCEIIENYPDDYPYPSCLVLGFGVQSQYIHVVCGIGPEFLYLITAYYPDKTKWSPDCKIRLRKE